jgi:hypothetical protein
MPQIVAPVRMRRAVSAAIETLEDRRLLSATISLQNLDGLPGSNRLVFNRIQNLNPDVNDVVHDTDTLAIMNTGDQPLTIRSLSLSDTTNWQLVSPPAAGTVVAVGHTLDVTVKFVAQSVPPNQPVNETNDTNSTDLLPPAQTGGVWDGTLTINSNDPATPASVVQLAGYWQYESEHEEEPNLQTIVNRLFGYGTDISNSQQPDYANTGSTVVPFGEEVMSGLWQAADPGQAVTVRELAAYHTQEDPSDPGTLLSQNFNWYSEASPSTNHLLFSHALREGQSLLPNILNSTTAPAEGSFSPAGGVFGFNIDGENSQDSLNTTDIQTYGRSGHAVRFYPARDSSGNLIANTWIVAMDYQNSTFDNSDYQDGLYLVTNMRPVTQAPAPANISSSSTARQVTVSWSAVSDGSLQGYNVYRSESASGPFTKLTSTPFNGTTYIDSSPASTTEYYQVSAVDSAGESEKADTAVGVAGSQGGTPNGPDLTLSAVTGTFKSSVIGNTFSGPSKVTLTNSGNQTAKGTVAIELFVSQSQTSVAGATEVTHITRNVNLKAGKSLKFALPGFRYSSSLNGQYFLVAQVQATKGITESSTANNLGASSAITVAAPFVDLDNLFTGTLPATFVPGKRTVLTVPVLNKGNVTAHGVATVTVSATTSSSGLGGTTLATLKLPVLLAAGKTAKYNLRFLVPSLTHGTYFVATNVTLSVDANAANNTAVSTGTFAA